MSDEQVLHNSKLIFLIPCTYVFVIWFIYWVEIQFDLNFNKYGIFPRTIVGLRGVLFSHFIHSNTSHLFNNSIPIFVLDIPPRLISMQIVIFPVHLVASSCAIRVDSAFMSLSMVM